LRGGVGVSFFVLIPRAGIRVIDCTFDYTYNGAQPPSFLKQFTQMALDIESVNGSASPGGELLPGWDSRRPDANPCSHPRAVTGIGHC
jgi:hypothetical protein